MIEIKQDLLDLLVPDKFTIPKVDVRDFYSVKRVSPPQFLLQERPSNDGDYINTLPAIVENTYTAEAYCKAVRVDGVTITQDEAAFKIMYDADKVLSEYGLSMIGSVTKAPYDRDSSVTRVVARYRARIDTRPDMFQLYRY